MTGIIANSVYEYLEMYSLLPVEQKKKKKQSKDKRSTFNI